MGRKKRFCNKHGLSHFPPTGKKCPGPKFCDLSLEGEVKDHTEQQGGVDVDVGLLHGSPSAPQKKQLAADHLDRAVEKGDTLRERVTYLEEALEANSDRLDEVLTILRKKEACRDSSIEVDDESTKKKRSSRVKARKQRDPSPSPSASSSDESTCSRSPERKKKDPKKRYARKKFLDPEEKIKSGDDLLLVGVKTIEKIIEDGDDPLPCVKHLRMLTEKVAKNVYKLDSLCKYDAVVRKRAGVKGVEEFGVIQHDEMFTYFTYDNTVKASGTQGSESKTGKFKSRNKKWSDIICTRFNSEEGCKLPCNFHHACLFCESRSHAKKDCKVYKKTKEEK